MVTMLTWCLADFLILMFTICIWHVKKSFTAAEDIKNKVFADILLMSSGEQEQSAALEE